MKATTLLVGAMAVLGALTFLPAPVQADTLCLVGNQACACTGCSDSTSGWDCAAGVGASNSSIKGVACTEPSPPPGNGTGTGPTTGVSRDFACNGLTTFTFATNSQRATYSQSFVHTASPTAAAPCGGVDVSPTYTTDDSEFFFDGRTLLIRHVAHGGFEPTLETTSIHFVDGGASYEQRYVNLVTGKTTWESRGFLTGAFVASVAPFGSDPLA